MSDEPHPAERCSESPFGGVVAGVAGLAGGSGSILRARRSVRTRAAFPGGASRRSSRSARAPSWPNRRVYVFHADDGFYVVSAICTHLGCNVLHQEKKGFACPCHGSVFGEDGHVLRGPAAKTLPRFAVTLSRRGEIVVDTRRTVGIDFRLKA